MNAKRILSLILALVMLCSVFLVSCAKDGDKDGGVYDARDKKALVQSHYQLMSS